MQPNEYLDPKIETMGREHLRELEQAKLDRQLDFLFARSVFFDPETGDTLPIESGVSEEQYEWLKRTGQQAQRSWSKRRELCQISCCMMRRIIMRLNLSVESIIVRSQILRRCFKLKS